MASALDLFYLDAGRYPSTSEGLAALVQRTPGVAAWNGPYLKGGSLPNDPWNHPYLYRSPGERGPYEIISYGSDGQEGGSGIAADISTENLTMRKMNRISERGFTLLEMVCVLALIAMMAAVLLPFVPRHTTRSRLQGYVLQTAALLEGRSQRGDPARNGRGDPRRSPAAA